MSSEVAIDETMKERVSELTEECKLMNERLEETERNWKEKLEKERERNAQAIKENKVMMIAVHVIPYSGYFLKDLIWRSGLMTICICQPL